VPASSAPTDWHGCFNWLRNCTSGTILRQHDLAANLRPLEEAALGRLTDWLPKLSFPVRIGEHAQTAFALGLMLDYARATGDTKFAGLLASKARQFYLADKTLSIGV